MNGWMIMSTKFTVLILFLSLSLANSVEYEKLGGEVIINTGSAAPHITFITWKHGGDIAMEWFGGETYSYRQFKGHSALNTSTGALTLSGLTRTHSGSYTAEINNHVADTTEIQVISGVPKPTVSEQCDTKWTRCLLTCEGNTTDAEPVTYSWWTSDMIQIYKGREFNITEDNQEYGFLCEMENPVSSEISDMFEYRFNPWDYLGSFIFSGCSILFLIFFIIFFECTYSKSVLMFVFIPLSCLTLLPLIFGIIWLNYVSRLGEWLVAFILFICFILLFLISVIIWLKYMDKVGYGMFHVIRLLFSTLLPLIVGIMWLTSVSRLGDWMFAFIPFVCLILVLTGFFMWRQRNTIAGYGMFHFIRLLSFTLLPLIFGIIWLKDIFGLGEWMVAFIPLFCLILVLIAFFMWRKYNTMPAIQQFIFISRLEKWMLVVISLLCLILVLLMAVIISFKYSSNKGEWLGVFIPLVCFILPLLIFSIQRFILIYIKEMKSEDVEGSVEEGQKMVGASTNREEGEEVVGASTNGDAGTSLSVQVTSGQTPTSSVVPLTSSQTEMINESSNQDKETPTEPSDEPEKSAEESNGEETTKPLLEEQN